MSAAAPTAAPGTAPKKSKKLLYIIVCMVFAGMGAAIPMFVNVPALLAGTQKDEKKTDKNAKDAKTVIVPCGDVVVNLSEDRLQRYLRVKLAVLVDAEAEKEAEELMTKKKAAVKSAIIAHLAGKSLKDVSGSAGVARMQRELLERIEEVLYPNGNSRLKSVLFEEYVVQ